MKLNRLGKYLLVFSAGIFALTVLSLVTNSDFADYFPEILLILLPVLSYCVLCLSLSLIFYNAPAVKRRRAIVTFSWISGFFFCAGIFFKMMRWPGAAIQVMLAVVLFGLGLLPLIIRSRYEKRKTLLSSKSLWLSMADMLSILLIVTGLLFRFLHWPGGTATLVVGLLLLIISFVGWNISFRKEVNRRLIAEEKLQKAFETIEEKHKEITDSINYAERIQRSFLASRELLDENLVDYFVFFQPRDVVSGDFYWAATLANGTFVYATADSTGHGVPGAIMSLLNISGLEKAVEHETAPAAILNVTRKHIIERLKKDGSKEGGKDGMDCCLIVLDKGKSQLRYAAANNPVWIVRKNELLGFASDKMPVGKHDKDQLPFTEHLVELQPGDVIYTFTDGMPDQFGGPKGKKFMYKQLKELLVSIASLPMQEQKQKLQKELNTWKGELEQVDDICIIGVRV